jgi:hypothetical protein
MSAEFVLKATFMVMLFVQWIIYIVQSHKVEVAFVILHHPQIIRLVTQGLNAILEYTPAILNADRHAQYNICTKTSDI